MEISTLLERAIRACEPATASGLAAALNVKPSAVSNWKHGRALPDEVSCAKIAELTSEPLARVLGIVGERRAISREAKAVWRRLATAAAVATLCVMTLPGMAQARAVSASIVPANVYYVILRRWLHRLAGKIGRPAWRLNYAPA